MSERLRREVFTLNLTFSPRLYLRLRQCVSNKSACTKIPLKNANQILVLLRSVLPERDVGGVFNPDSTSSFLLRL